MSVINIFILCFTSDNGDVNFNGVSIITAALIVNICLAGFSSFTVATRICYAMARDGALPASKFLSYLSEKNVSPDRIITVVFIFDSLLCLLPLVSTTAFIAMTSITTIGY